MEWIQKQYPYICCLLETYFQSRDTYRLEVKGCKNIFHVNGNQKKIRVAILISDKIDFKIKNIIRDKEWQYIMTKANTNRHKRGINSNTILLWGLQHPTYTNYCCCH